MSTKVTSATRPPSIATVPQQSASNVTPEEAPAPKIGQGTAAHKVVVAGASNASLSLAAPSEVRTCGFRSAKEVQRVLQRLRAVEEVELAETGASLSKARAEMFEAAHAHGRGAHKRYKIASFKLDAAIIAYGGPRTALAAIAHEEYENNACLAKYKAR